MDVKYRAERGPQAVFGDTTFEGLERVQEDFLRNKLPWRQGDPFDGVQLRLAQRRLMGSDLFSSARFIRADDLDEDKALALTVEIRERKHRSITFGAGYRTDEGFRGRAGWEHRNLFRSGERLSLMTTVAEIGYGVESQFLIPDYLRPDQNLKLSAQTALDEPEAYRSRSVSSVIALERLLRTGWVGSVGLGFRYVDVEQLDETERFGLVYIPVTLDADRSDDMLNPLRGWRSSMSVAPYRDVLDTEVEFLKMRLSGIYYELISRRRGLYGATRLVLGSIVGVSRDAIPADERFYAGGGGSVRGYSYQSVGPLEGKDPLGGKALLLWAAELRWRWTTEFGVVFFVDGGTSYEGSMPDNSADFRWGSGVGLRYFTPVGPLRFDFAVPLNRRAGIDDSFQFYISLGQAF